jgi:K+-transporting ATPase ATPase C chain
MRRQLVPALIMLLVMTGITGVVYPLLVTGIAQTAFPEQANGSLIVDEDEVVGSRWIGQPFTDPGYFHPRPSATGYLDGLSSGSNLGPTNQELIDSVGARADAYREENGLSEDEGVPVDAVTSSASGLDPHISEANAKIQARRVAAARGLGLNVVIMLVSEHTEGRGLGFLGEPGVNVLELNLALDEL